MTWVAVLKLQTKKIGFLPKKSFQVSQNFKLTPAPSEIASQFPPLLTFESCCYGSIPIKVLQGMLKST
jgi:hypothetical protein